MEQVRELYEKAHLATCEAFTNFITLISNIPLKTRRALTIVSSIMINIINNACVTACYHLRKAAEALQRIGFTASQKQTQLLKGLIAILQKSYTFLQYIKKLYSMIPFRTCSILSDSSEVAYCCKAVTSYLIDYLGGPVAISLAYYRAISDFDLPSWAAVTQFWRRSWRSLLDMVYRACNLTEGPAINILGISFTDFLLVARDLIIGRLATCWFTLRNMLIDSGLSWTAIAKSAKETILPTLLTPVGLALSIGLYRSDADFLNIISTVYAIVFNVLIFTLLRIFDIIYVIAVVCNLIGGFFHKLADASTTCHTYLQFLVYENSESLWFMLSTAIMSFLCSILLFALLYLLVISLSSSARSTSEIPGAATVHKLEGLNKESERESLEKEIRMIPGMIKKNEESRQLTIQREQIDGSNRIEPERIKALEDRIRLTEETRRLTEEATAVLQNYDS